MFRNEEVTRENKGRDLPDPAKRRGWTATSSLRVSHVECIVHSRLMLTSLHEGKFSVSMRSLTRD